MFPKAFRSLSLLVVVLTVATGTANAAGSKDHGHGEKAAIGQPGTPAKVSRTIEVRMFDNYYEPESLSIKEGETIRFVIHNKGALVHEFNIATADLSARRQITINKSDVWQDDLLKRNAAIDTLEGLARENPGATGRITRMLSVYVREMTRE